MAHDIESISRQLLGQPNSKLSTKSELRFGHHGSVSVVISGDKAGSWFDHERGIGGGVYEMLEEYVHVRGGAATQWLINHGYREEQQRIIATYDYRDENDKLLYQVVRFEPKKFRQRRPNGPNNWIWNLEGVERVPYRLPELIFAARQAPWRVYIVEGEKDADRLRQDWQVLATTNSEGVGKWQVRWSRYFAGAEVVIIPDNDEQGKKHAAEIAVQLLPVAAWVKVVRLDGLPEKGDISDWMNEGETQGAFDDLIDATPRFGIAPRQWLPEGQPTFKWAGSIPDAIPPRRWLLGTNFCVGYLSGLTGAGGTGKTALRLLQLIALALGRSDLTGERCFVRTKVAIICLEDDENELRRRIRAICFHHKINEADLVGWLGFWTPQELRFINQGKYNEIEPGGLADALEGLINENGIGLVSIDPFVKSHGANENDNGQIDRVATMFLHVAHACGCAVDYVHHDRKGIGEAGDASRARGASALANASRILKTLTKMDEDEADVLGVGEDERRYLVRLDDGKINIAPPSDKAVWYKLVGVDIHNGDDTYPNGDNVQVVERWEPPGLFDGVTKAMIADIFDMLRNKPPGGEKWLYRANANNWAGQAVMRFTGSEAGHAMRLLKAWVEGDLRAIVLVDYLNKRGTTVKAVEVNEIALKAILGPLYREPRECGENG